MNDEAVFLVNDFALKIADKYMNFADVNFVEILAGDNNFMNDINLVNAVKMRQHDFTNDNLSE